MYFVLGKTSQPSLFFVGEARSLQSAKKVLYLGSTRLYSQMLASAAKNSTNKNGLAYFAGNKVTKKKKGFTTLAIDDGDARTAARAAAWHSAVGWKLDRARNLHFRHSGWLTLPY